MGLTVTNTNTLNLLGILSNTERSQTNVLTQLSTGLRINRGADDPAGLIALKNLQAELTAVDQAIANDQRTDAVLGVADTALGEIHGLLNEIESLIIASSSEANLSASELSANQAQIDDAISSINRIVRTTAFNGKRLIDGSGAIDTINTGGDILDLNIYSRSNLESDLTLTVTVTTAAAEATSSGDTADSVNFNGSTTNGAVELAITGSLGTATITVASSSSLATAVTTINAAKDSTGVSAVASGNYLVYSSTQTGSDNFLMVDVLSGGAIGGAPDTFADVTKITGTDAVGNINGQTFTADGEKVSFNVGGVSGSFSLDTDATTEAFTVQTTGGFTFQLGSDGSTQVTLGIDALFAHKLGGGDSGGYLSQVASGGTADLSDADSRSTALAVVREAINQVAVAQGRIGGFQKFQVQPSIRSLQSSKVGLSAAASVIGDTDYAVATAELNKQTVLLQSGISLLGLANQQAAQILSLIGG
ncbi:MAG: Flagellin [Phycisphaerae bacterium]|nr:Flagellin [Phycisphaerae bacterium]